MHCLVNLQKLMVLFFLIQFNFAMDTESRTNVTNEKMWSEEDTRKSTSYELEARKGGEKQQDMMSRILPLMIIPFMISTAIIPMMLVSLKFMLLKSAFIGKLAVLLLLINMFRRQSSGGGVYSHNAQLKEMTMAHYGYSGDEEYGAYINRRSLR